MSLRGLVTVAAAFAALVANADLVEAQGKTPVLIAGPPAVWATYAPTVGVADILNRTTSLNVTVRSYGGALAIVQALIAGQADLGAGPKDKSWAMGFEGSGDFKGKPPARQLRTAIVFNNLIDALAVPAQSRVRSVADLRGKRIAWYTNESNDWTEAILRAYGVDPDKDITKIPVPNYASAAREMRLGRIDAGEIAPRQPVWIEVAEAVGKLNILPVERDKFEWARQRYPALFAGVALITIKPGWLPHLGMTEPTPVHAFPVSAATREDVSEETIYTYTKGWLNNVRQIRSLSPVVEDFGPDVVQTASSLPYHRGAIRALKEAKLWTAAMEEAHRAALRGSPSAR